MKNEFCIYFEIKSSRCRWRAIDMVVIFVNNVVQLEFESLLKSQNLLVGKQIHSLEKQSKCGLVKSHTV